MRELEDVRVPVRPAAISADPHVVLVVDGDAVLQVRDTGIGIATGDLPHLFERFWRADPARSRTGDRPGTGLGLAITKWIAEAHGGSITVQSRPGRGSVFTVRLPRETIQYARGTAGRVDEVTSPT